jgi:hypothetical protein
MPYSLISSFIYYFLHYSSFFATLSKLTPFLDFIVLSQYLIFKFITFFSPIFNILPIIYFYEFIPLFFIYNIKLTSKNRLLHFIIIFFLFSIHFLVFLLFYYFFISHSDNIHSIFHFYSLIICFILLSAFLIFINLLFFSHIPLLTIRYFILIYIFPFYSYSVLIIIIGRNKKSIYTFLFIFLTNLLSIIDIFI